MNATKRMFLFGLVGTTLLLAGCEGTYLTGAYVAAPYSGPYFGGWGPYGGGDFIFGGRHYYHDYGYHHFYGHSFGVNHFHGGGFHGGGFHGGGHR
jgi:hypothetical protein